MNFYNQINFAEKLEIKAMHVRQFLHNSLLPVMDLKRLQTLILLVTAFSKAPATSPCPVANIAAYTAASIKTCKNQI